MSDQKKEIRDKVRAYILEASFAEKELIKDDSLIFREGFFDSMGFALLLAFLDETFATKTGDADLVEENFESINAISEFVLKKKG